MRFRDSPRELALSFHCVGSGTRTQSVRLGSKLLYLLSQLAGLVLFSSFMLTHSSPDCSGCAPHDVYCIHLVLTLSFLCQNFYCGEIDLV